RRQKGINQIIDAISKNGDYSLLVIGDGKVREDLERQAVRNNCFDRCLFLGYKKEAHKYLKFIDVYVMSSYQEGFGLVNLEAALYNKPVVCSNINVFKEIFNESCVSFFDLNDTDSLIVALSKIKQNYNYFSENLNQLVATKYTPERMGKEYFLLYEDLKFI
ncbi:MAG TPA: glycosyltransferase family 4 protein, partial [Aquella sp.]|nr:glycosyltransferase family 4 protein [Aquella sp.]